MSKKTDTVPDKLIYDDAALAALKLGRVQWIFIIYVLEMLGKRVQQIVLFLCLKSSNVERLGGILRKSF